MRILTVNDFLQAVDTEHKGWQTIRDCNILLMTYISCANIANVQYTPIDDVYQIRLKGEGRKLARKIKPSVESKYTKACYRCDALPGEPCKDRRPAYFGQPLNEPHYKREQYGT